MKEYPIQVKVIKLTSPTLMHDAFSSTVRSTIAPSLAQAYRWMHSPIRTQMFAVYMEVPTFVSVHFVRHKAGVEHFVCSNRDDRGGGKDTARDTMINHMMLLNAETLITMAHKRLCGCAHTWTQRTMELIRDRIRAVDPDLADVMVPLCGWRNGRCDEPKCCGRNTHFLPEAPEIDGPVSATLHDNPM